MRSLMAMLMLAVCSSHAFGEVGACCINGGCLMLDEARCAAVHGTFHADAGCDGIDCVFCPGDLDGDGDVDVNDLLLLLAAWGPCP